MATLQSLVNNILIFAPGAPEPLIIDAYLRAAREFFGRTRIYRQTFTSGFSVGTTNGIYTLTVPTGTEMFDAALCKYDDVELDKKSKSKMELDYDFDGTPMVYRIDLPNTLVVAPLPSGDISTMFKLIGVLRPTLTATTIDDTMVDRYGFILELGTIARLQAIPQKPWSDSQMALANLMMFNGYIDEYRDRASDGDMTGVVRTTTYGGY